LSLYCQLRAFDSNTACARVYKVIALAIQFATFVIHSVEACVNHFRWSIRCTAALQSRSLWLMTGTDRYASGRLVWRCDLSGAATNGNLKDARRPSVRGFHGDIFINIRQTQRLDLTWFIIGIRQRRFVASGDHVVVIVRPFCRRLYIPTKDQLKLLRRQDLHRARTQPRNNCTQQCKQPRALCPGKKAYFCYTRTSKDISLTELYQTNASRPDDLQRLYFIRCLH